MKIPQLFEQKKIVFSLEVFPPKKTGALERAVVFLNLAKPARSAAISKSVIISSR